MTCLEAVTGDTKIASQYYYLVAAYSKLEIETSSLLILCFSLLLDGWVLLANLIAWNKIVLALSSAKYIFPIEIFLLEILHLVLISSQIFLFRNTSGSEKNTRFYSTEKSIH